MMETDDRTRPVPTLTMPDPAILDPGLYGDAVRTFNRHFLISERDPELLETVLIRFSGFPYENISKIIKHNRFDRTADKLRLPQEVMDDHVRYHFGGTCFSLSFFLSTLLIHNGFACYPVMADMRSGPNTHCALVVQRNGRKFLVDPGYLLNRPMEIHPDKPRLYHSDVSGIELVFEPKTETYHLSTFNRLETKWRYRFQDVPVPQDVFLRFWISSFGWNTMHGICLTKIEKDRMIYIHKNHMRQTTVQGKTSANIRQTYHQTIASVFSIDPGRVEEALSALDENMRRERESGLWVPKSKKTPLQP